MLDVNLNPDFYFRMMDYMYERVQGYAQQYIDAGCDIFDIGANMANGRMVSAEQLETFMLPYENRLADFAQKQGVPCLYHNCGYALQHIDIYHKLSHKLWGYVAPPPHGDVPMIEAVKRCPKDMILWGGIDQIDFLRQAKPAEVTEKVRELLALTMPRGNYILGTTDYLETHTPHENLRAMVEAGHKYGQFVND